MQQLSHQWQLAQLTQLVLLGLTGQLHTLKCFQQGRKAGIHTVQAPISASAYLSAAM